MTHASDGDLQPYVAAEYLALGDALSPLGAAGGRVPRRSQPRRDPWPGRNRTARALAPGPDEVMRIVLDDLTRGGIHEHFGTSTSGRRLEATDLDWSYGSGATLSGTSADLALILCGRRIPGGRFDGGGSSILA